MRVIAETRHMQPVLDRLEFPNPRRHKEQTIPISKSRMDADHLFLVGALWVESGSADQPRLLIQAALELAQDEELLSEYQHMLIRVLLVGVLLSTLGGFWVARQGLHPLAQITEVVQRVSVNQLNERINLTQWPQELSTLAQAFDEMLNRLDTSFARLSQFSADLAHELRTPVNNLMGEAEVVLSRQRTTEDYRQVLESSLEECSRMARMIDELLFLARAENPNTQINPTGLQAMHELQAVCDFYEGLAEEQGVTINCRGDIHLYADASLLRRALSNVLANALQYTPAHGTIEMIARQHADRSAEIRISDSGCGIDASKLSNIFDRFYRADSARSRNTQGTGLGLAIVKSIMELHSGSVRIDSQLGQGTCITLTFPPRARQQTS
jgi:two-component system heavy metal sensor histidine kinase CusS